MEKNRNQEGANLSTSPSEPQIKRHPTNVTLLVESKAVLPCITLGNPKPDVTWLKDDELIKVQSSSCFSTNKKASGITGRLAFSLPAFVTLDLSNEAKTKLLSQVSDRVTILDYGALKIHNIQKEDAGQYRCVARNSFGLAFSKPVTIEVQGTYANRASHSPLRVCTHASKRRGCLIQRNRTACNFVRPAPARILQVPREKRVEYGSQVSLECNATGNPVPTITWLENGNTVSSQRQTHGGRALV